MSSSEIQDDHSCQKKKLLALRVAGVALLAIILCAVARYVATLNDWLSGPPRYARSIADVMAEGVARNFSGMYPVIVAESRNSYCQPVRPISTAKVADIYVISYSDRTQSLCVTLWQRAGLHSEPKPTAIINEATGHNYGQRLQGDIPVVELRQYPINFPGNFLASLYWRPNSGRSALQGTSQTFQSLDLLIEQELQGFSINMSSLRKRVAERHNFLNRLLSLSLGLMITALVVAAWWMRVLYRRVRRDCGAYGFHLGFTKYLRTTCSDITNLARETYCTQHCQQQAELRAERILRHTRQETRDDLRAWLEIVRDDPQRARIESCLLRGHLVEMKDLLERLENRPTERTPDERLSSLVESLKEYCAGSELDAYRRMAFDLFQDRGFRNARDFVVHAHFELRRKAREAERNKMAEKNSAVNGAPLEERNGSKNGASKPNLHHSGK